MLGALKIRVRTLKPFWFLYNLLHWRSLRRNRKLYDQAGVRKSVFGTIAHRDFDGSNGATPWLDRDGAPEAFASSADAASLPDGVAEKIPGWIEDGFMVLEGQISSELVDEAVADVGRLLDQGVVSMHFRGEQVVRDSYEHSDPVRRMFTDPDIGRTLRFLFGRPAQLFQTIDFFKGSEQPMHSDAFHMTTQPPGYLIGGWIALEDVRPDAGPVYYLPGSHRLPYLMSEDLGVSGSAFSIPLKDEAYGDRVAAAAKQAAVEPVDFLAKKGDVLLWHHNLMHGGRPVKDPDSTRRSVVAHYFAEDVICYHEVTERPAILEGSVPVPA